ncbi:MULTISPECIES: UDP-N-acetylglucosamine 1-carboxyvinyltransferase [unclassified Curtobacterium]|uniref:UDP-N-acetylglucosamine 1-carboxyvinyltransferase n=1 Tax=unclassified Curtobacterium TaxID=257496 RepID=UPI0008DC6B5A|nr:MULTISPECIES: UDP-N-acetylglucosamine 1-carboxyvinyltransferase [unclassified Curtobacterium]MCC8908820.1 UDP-N-acetylglucosamine 1-carboxyvinyltransferase [Curtobacterium sp. GD1]MCT9621032.1 UDP-N-acetylglucosamine 1-carboxyvinyltransferase [Curtobacterium sp. C2H10]MDR6172056.1 UDP-N-acetylglucosamine 1-carboxyvinyltransferase [Curtobacterium sp. SORGH_AS_0776]OII19682.1 UDP-N-acetylglucosamine 1-carboxyvinyltransferase [Curtobacterium sp. MCBA15_016]OII25578.1 UDP-N-acetylglucosamine 1-
MNSLVQDAAAAGARVGLKSDEIVIRGGKPLVGRIEVRGAKNLATKAMVASLLGDTPSILKDVPDISDVKVVRGLLEVHGVRITDPARGELILDPSNVESAHFAEIDAHAGSSRIPILFCGPLLHKLGEAFIPDLGGCRIGDRPIDFHLDALRAMGAVVDKQVNGIHLTAPDGLKGAYIELPYPSVGATEQVLLSATLAEGVTELRNAAIEPEIMDLIAILQKMGAIVSVEPNRVIFIEGVQSLRGYTHRAINDRNEAASWASAALATNGDIFVEGAKQQELMTFLNVFRKVGGGFDIQEDGIRFYRELEVLKPVVIETDVHPGFMTDWQQPLVVALTQAAGQSIVHETVYENRFGFTDALNEMGADIVVHKEGLPGHDRRVARRPFEQAAVITGPTTLHAANVRVPDLRGGFSHLIAALTAEGESHITNVGIISRGYEHFIPKLRKLGADFDFAG